MLKTFKSIAVLLLLLAAQHGAVVHELHHLAEFNRASVRIGAEAALHGPCALCPAYAQASSPAFAPTVQAPALMRGAPLDIPASLHAAIDTASPRACSRGPPGHCA